MSKAVPNTPPFDGFNSWRKYQKETIETLLVSNKKFNMLNAPTGSGKSIVGMTVADLTGTTYLLVSTKNLQHQMEDDFPGIAVLKGMNNYQCAIKNVTCDNCLYGDNRKVCPEIFKCPYNKAKIKALESKFVIFNYSMWLVTQTFTRSFKEADLIICDEAHLLEGELMKFVSVTFIPKFFTDLGLIFPIEDEKIILDSLDEAKGIAEDRYLAYQEEIDILLETRKPSEIDIRLVYKRNKEQNKCRKIIFFKSIYKPDEWILDYKENKSIQFKPVKIDKFTDYHVFNHAKKTLLMSATLPPASVICNNLGINPDTTMYYDVPSTFPPKNRPIYFLPIGKMNKDNWQNAIIDIMDWINKYCEKYKVKILIHTVNNKIRNTLLESKSFAPDYHKFYHNTSEEREEALEDFKQGKAPCMLITPSMENGIDLKHNLCRTQFILKMPYADMGDKQVRARMKIDKHWYTTNAINRLVQATGRIIRAEDDYGKTYIFDSCFTELYATWNKKFFPKWFKGAVHVRSKNKNRGSK